MCGVGVHWVGRACLCVCVHVRDMCTHVNVCFSGRRKLGAVCAGPLGGEFLCGWEGEGALCVCACVRALCVHV